MLNRTERKMDDDKKIGGVFSGQRRGVVIIDASSDEELGRTLVCLPVWSRLTWNVTQLESMNETERQWKIFSMCIFLQPEIQHPV
jgi:hypothetical protein